MDKTNWNELRDRAYKIACDHGFHEGNESKETALMLVITELSEAVNSDRIGRLAHKDAFNARMKDADEFDFQSDFNELIKDSVEDELADTVIRLLDYSGMKKINLFKYRIEFTSKKNKKKIEKYSFTKFCFYCCSMLTQYLEIIDVVISVIYCFCELHNIDLIWHIEQKMKYNELRPYKNGKKY